MKKKVLLLNPPGSLNFIRDYYCSKVSKANYVSPPIVLLFLSGILSGEYDVDIIDAVVMRLKPAECRKMILSKEYYAIIFLTGTVSWREDFPFMKSLKLARDVKLIANGDIFFDDPGRRLEELDFIDALLLNFSTDDIVKYLKNDQEEINNMVYRKGEKIIRGKEIAVQNEFIIPIPKHDLFPLNGYKFPFSLRHPMSVVMTDYGCPFQCSFCVINKIGFRVRSLDNVIGELKYLFGLGIKEIFFIDQTFGVLKKRTLDLCNIMLNNNFKFTWSCFSRADVLDEEVLLAMKKVGCHTVIFGVESGSQRILDIYNKKITKGRIEKTFSICRKLKIRTSATFIMGLPEETIQDCLDTIEFAKKLDCDFAAFNIAVPRPGTDLRSKAIENGIISKELDVMDQSGTYAVMDTLELKKDDVVRLKDKAIVEFYLRPQYFLKRIMDIRSCRDIFRQINEGASLLGGVLNK